MQSAPDAFHICVVKHELAIDDLGKRLVIVDVANPAGKYLYAQGDFVAIGGSSSREQQPDIAVHSIPCDRKRRLDVLVEVGRAAAQIPKLQLSASTIGIVQGQNDFDLFAAGAHKLILNLVVQCEMPQELSPFCKSPERAKNTGKHALATLAPAAFHGLQKGISFFLQRLQD